MTRIGEPCLATKNQLKVNFQCGMKRYEGQKSNWKGFLSNNK